MISDGKTWVALDLETTGLSPRDDRIVEVGAVRFDGEGREIATFERLVNPLRTSNPRARAVHGIDDRELSRAPTADVILPQFLDFLGDPDRTTLLAHNAGFDAAFLGAELARLGRSIPGHGVVDTLALARRGLPHLPSHRLDGLARQLGLDPFGPHRGHGRQPTRHGPLARPRRRGRPDGQAAAGRLPDPRPRRTCARGEGAGRQLG